MSSIVRRIRKLEIQQNPPENEAARRAVTTLIERRRQRAEARGEPFVDLRERNQIGIDYRPRTIAEMLRQAHQRRRQRRNENSHQTDRPA